MPFQARLLLVTLLLAVVVAACGAPASALPDSIRQGPPEVRDAYRFALANRDTLQYIPCYCGCGADGHRSNYDCYIKEIRPDGTATFSDHAFT
jgi:hypothetical protein